MKFGEKVSRAIKKINQEVSLNEVIGVDKDGSEIVLEDLLDNHEPHFIDQIYNKDQINELMDNFKNPYLVLIACVLSIYSGFQYFISNKKILMKEI